MARFSAVLFDMDGVLLDSVEAWRGLLNAVLEIHGGPQITEEAFAKNHLGSTMRGDLNKLLGKEKGVKAYEDARRLRESHFKGVGLFDGTEKVLADLKSNGIRSALVSNASTSFSIPMLEACGIRDYLDVVLGADLVARPKPAPDMVELAVKELRVTRNKAIMVGDARNDILAAKGAGVKATIMNNECEEADYRIKRLEEILEIVL